MSMLFVVAIDGVIVAHSRNKKVCKYYAKHYMESHPDSVCSVLKSISGDKESLKKDDDYELVCVGKIYIQRKYEQAYLIYGCPDIQEYKEAVRLLNKELLEEPNLLKLMKINDSINLLKEQWYERSHYVPTCKEMELLRQQLIEYEYCVYGT